MELISKILVLAHCLLNKSTRWWQNGKPIERNRGLAEQVVRFALESNIGIVQMPCPEFTFCGNPRPSRTKDEYESLSGFKRHCVKMANSVVEQLKTLTFMSRKPRIQILAVIGIKNSPSCAIESVLRKINGKIQSSKERGIFIEILEKEMLKIGLKPPFLEFDFDRPNKIVRELNKILSES